MLGPACPCSCASVTLRPESETSTFNVQLSAFDARAQAEIKEAKARTDLALPISNLRNTPKYENGFAPPDCCRILSMMHGHQSACCVR
jgi:hypothetical protein